VNFIGRRRGAALATVLGDADLVAIGHGGGAAGAQVVLGGEQHLQGHLALAERDQAAREFDAGALSQIGNLLPVVIAGATSDSQLLAMFDAMALPVGHGADRS